MSSPLNTFVNLLLIGNICYATLILHPQEIKPYLPNVYCTPEDFQSNYEDIVLILGTFDSESNYFAQYVFGDNTTTKRLETENPLDLEDTILDRISPCEWNHKNVRQYSIEYLNQTTRTVFLVFPTFANPKSDNLQVSYYDDIKGMFYLKKYFDNAKTLKIILTFSSNITSDSTSALSALALFIKVSNLIQDLDKFRNSVGFIITNASHFLDQELPIKKIEVLKRLYQILKGHRIADFIFEIIDRILIFRHNDSTREMRELIGNIKAVKIKDPNREFDYKVSLMSQKLIKQSEQALNFETFFYVHYYRQELYFKDYKYKTIECDCSKEYLKEVEEKKKDLKLMQIKRKIILQQTIDIIRNLTDSEQILKILTDTRRKLNITLKSPQFKQFKRKMEWFSFLQTITEGYYKLILTPSTWITTLLTNLISDFSENN